MAKIRAKAPAVNAMNAATAKGIPLQLLALLEPLHDHRCVKSEGLTRLRVGLPRLPLVV